MPAPSHFMYSHIARAAQREIDAASKSVVDSACVGDYVYGIRFVLAYLAGWAGVTGPHPIDDFLAEFGAAADEANTES